MVNNELNRLEPIPQKSKKKPIASIVTTVLLIIVYAVIYVLKNSPIFLGEPYPIKVENMSIIPGETTVGELMDAGYDLSDYEHSEWVMENYTGYNYYFEVIDMTAKVGVKTHYQMEMVKDGLAYATIYIYNESLQEITVAECKVHSVEVHRLCEGVDQAGLMDISFSEVSPESLTLSVGAEPKDNGKGRYVWKNGSYSMIYELNEDGITESIKSEFDIAGKELDIRQMTDGWR